MNTLAREFESAIKSAIIECKALGYYPARFEQMLQEIDTITLAKNFVKSGELQHGLKKLKEMNRLDLSSEGIMLNPRFEPLFTRQELEAARWRLKQL